MEVEAQRLENLKYKAKLLADLNLESKCTARSAKRIPSTKQPLKRPRTDLDGPTRASARIASSSSKPSYSDPPTEKYVSVERAGSNKRKRKSEPSYKDADLDQRTLNPAVDAEEIRAGWTKWEATVAQPTRDEDGTFHFEDFPDFTPNKSPEEMIREGCFGGSYFRPLKSRKLGIIVEDDWKELPESWYSGLDVKWYMANPWYEPDVNKFKVSCGQSIEEWEANGWIASDFDIRGWFQWYCRFYMGRRCDDDTRQISRWRKCVGETGRWRRMLLKKYVQMGVRDVFDDGEEEDKEVSPVMHQTCHHWAYQVRQTDLDEAWRRPTK